MADHVKHPLGGVGKAHQGYEGHVQPASAPLHGDAETMAPESEPAVQPPGPEDFPDLTSLFFAERMKGFIAPARVGRLEPFLDKVEVIGENPEDQVTKDRE